MISEKISQSKWFSFFMLIMILLSVPVPIEYRPNVEHPLQFPIKTSLINAAKTELHHSKNVQNMQQQMASRGTVLTVQDKMKGIVEISSQQHVLAEPPSIEVIATGYYAGVESTGKHPGHPEYGITYSGVKVRRATVSTIAADPEVFPLGTILHIPGYGYGVVADTGSAIKGNKLDLYFETKQKVFTEWGKKKVKVTVVQRGDGKITEQMLDKLNEVYAAKETPKSAM